MAGIKVRSLQVIALLLAVTSGLLWGFYAAKREKFPTGFLLKIYWSSVSRVRPRLETQFDYIKQHSDIVFVGDSLTASGLWEEAFRGQTIACRGQPGQTVQEILQWADNVVALSPKKIFVMAGVNDVYRATPLQEIVDAYTRLIECFTACGAQVIIQSTIECNGAIAGKARLLAIRELNEQLKVLASRNPQVKWLDLNESMANNGGLRVEFAAADGKHLSAQGYLAWYQALRPLVSMQMD
jgi:lysophospholipase L1-like esterase